VGAHASLHDLVRLQGPSNPRDAPTVRHPTGGKHGGHPNLLRVTVLLKDGRRLLQGHISLLGQRGKQLILVIFHSDVR